MLIQGFSIRSIAVRASDTAAVATDEYFNLVALLLPGTGTNGAQNNTFLDSSTNAFSITRNGNPTQGTFSPFSQTGWSGYFDGSGDNLSVADNAAFEFGSGSFTVEMWFYLGASGNNALITKNRSGTSPEGGLAIDVSTTTIRTYIDGNAGTTLVPNITTTISLNTWYHLAVVRSVSGGTNNYVFLNGVLVGSSTTSTAFADTSQPLRIGTDNLSGSNYNQLTGYISNLRIVKGTAVYTSAFTPPTAPLTAISGTSLLTCQSNRFIDNSTNAFAITVNGNTSVEAFAPFDPTTAYAASTVGGSGYFDGTGDYFSIADNTALDMEASSFTIEAWVYAPSTINSNSISIYSKRATTEIYGGVIFGIDSSNRPLCYATVDGSNWNVTMTSGTQTIVLRTWNHVALTRNGNIWTIWVNGVSSQTTTVSGTVPNNAAAMTVNAGAADGGFTGSAAYIAGLRVVKGTAVYTAAFTPPTAPPTAIANTSLLLNYTNAGITDAAAKNVLETVGSAQISTAQSKFGGSSMAFDGTGDYLITRDNPNFVYGTGDFTIEFWVRFTATGEYMHVYDQRPASTDGAYPTIRLNQTGNGLEYVSTSAVRISGGSITTGVWYHIAVARAGTSTKMFLDGTQVGSTYTDSTNYLNGTNRPFIGGSGYHVTSLYFQGYIDDLRITKGYARYTTTFTPPTTAFPLS